MDSLQRVYSGSDVPTKKRERSGSASKQTAPAVSESTDEGPHKEPEPFVETPKAVKRIPVFGGLLSTHDHALNDNGIEAGKRILVVLALEYPLLNYAPLLPDLGTTRHNLARKSPNIVALVLLTLHYLPESASFALVYNMLSESATPPYIAKKLHELKLKGKIDYKQQVPSTSRLS